MVEKNDIIEALKKVKMGKSISLERLMEKLNIKTPEELEELKKMIEELISEYKVYRIDSPTPEEKEEEKAKYKAMAKTNFRKGIFHKYRDGRGKVYVTTSYEKNGETIVKEEKFIIPTGDNKALHGDEVLIEVDKKTKTAEIKKIIKRDINSIVGEVYREGSSYFVKSLDKKYDNLIVALEGEHVEGNIVSVELTEQRADNFYMGNITGIFQHKDDPKEAILLEAFKCGMPEGFSKESKEQLKYIPTKVKEEDFMGRKDFTDWEIFSIDGKDTKDKDDCISIKKLSNGHVILGVHIADVAHYVPENSPIDKDAFIKGTSYYFGGCVEPQLPRELSNGICSLNDGENRLTKTILIEYDEYANVISRGICRSVINSKIGMNYEDVNKFLNEGILVPEYEKYQDTLKEMQKLAEKLHKKRMKAGAISFDRSELKFKYDEKKYPIDVAHRNQGTSEKIIEEFMLAANTNIGEMLEEKGLPCIYRIHGAPNEERLAAFLKLLELIGMPFKHEAEDICKDKKLLQALTVHINQNEELKSILNDNLIRCMSHAKYSFRNIGHYGTGFDTYLHFTSPIRRLADLGISRIIDECILETDPIKQKKNISKWKEQSPKYAYQATKMERIEEEVEREVDALNTVRYLSKHREEFFEGTIIELSSRGITVQLDNLLIGRVRFRNLSGNYCYDPENLTLLSISGHDNYYIGDKLRLKLVETDPTTKLVAFKVLEKISENNYYQKNYTEEERKAASKKVKLKIRRNNNNRSQYYY